MKCDKLKPLLFSINDLAYVDEPTSQRNFQNPHDHAVYKATEVDAAIAELKEEVNNLLMQNKELCQALQVMYSAEEYTKLQDKNAELKAKLENVQASMYADVVDANMENRRLQRALWVARALRAKEKQQLFHFSLDYEKLCIDGFFDPYSGRRELSPKQWIKVFNKVEIKCLKKAEEYK